MDKALAFYQRLQHANGGDTEVGRKMGRMLAQAGFEEVRMDAEYECYPNREIIADYLALRLELAGLEADTVEALRQWSRQPGGLFAQTWVSAVAQKKGGEAA